MNRQSAAGTRTRPFTEAEIKAARNESEDIWTLSNNVLYKLCQNYPGHSNLEEIVTKILIIGKTYSAAIERRPTSSGAKLKVEDYYKKVASEFKALDLDVELRRMQSTKPSDFEDVKPALRLHKLVMDAIKKFSEIWQRSFASKYLHFHAPNWFFIFDSIATRELKKQIPRPPHVEEFADNVDKDYGDFVTRAWILRQELVQLGQPLLTPREIDRLLYKRQPDLGH